MSHECDRYSPHLLIVAMNASASLTKHVPATFRRAIHAYARPARVNTDSSDITAAHEFASRNVESLARTVDRTFSLPLGVARDDRGHGKTNSKEGHYVGASVVVEQPSRPCSQTDEGDTVVRDTELEVFGGASRDVTASTARATRSNRISATKCGNRLPRPPRRD